jgi:hypothetical protein
MLVLVAVMVGTSRPQPRTERRPNYAEYGSSDNGCEPAGAEGSLSRIIGE